jgi:hypothetical protein
MPFKIGKCVFCVIARMNRKFGSIGCSFKFLLKVGVVSLQSKNTKNAKSKVRFKQLSLAL